MYPKKNPPPYPAHCWGYIRSGERAKAVHVRGSFGAFGSSLAKDEAGRDVAGAGPSIPLGILNEGEGAGAAGAHFRLFVVISFAPSSRCYPKTRLGRCGGCWGICLLGIFNERRAKRQGQRARISACSWRIFRCLQLVVT